VKGPQDWTPEEAYAAQRTWIASGGAADAPESPTGRWLVYGQLADMQRAFEAGQHRAWQLFTTIYVCAAHGLALPEWAALAFSEGWRRVVRFDTKSWDKAFGSPLPKKADLKALSKRRTLALRVFLRVGKLHAERDVPIDEGMWLRVRKELTAEGYRISNSGVRDLYYFAKKLLHAPTSPRKRKKTSR
jgi:hypothetical protein